MEYLFEFILELVLEGSIEATKSNKVPKPIKYTLLAFIVLFFIFGIGLIYLASFLILRENIICSIIFFLLATFLLIESVVKFIKTYIKKTNK